MKLIDEIRRDNIRTLEAEFGSMKKLADQVGVSESQMSQWANGSEHSATGKKRGMRRDSCAKIERAAKKPEGWLDLDHSNSVGTSAPLWPFTAKFEDWDRLSIPEKQALDTLVTRFIGATGPVPIIDRDEGADSLIQKIADADRDLLKSTPKKRKEKDKA